MQTEQSIHKQLSIWLKLQYGGTIFHTDFAAGCRLSIGQAKKNKALQSGKSWPDLFIAKPMGNYHGLFIEIKKSKDEVYLKDGETLAKKQHIVDQGIMLTRLRKLGYQALFGCGFDECKAIVEEYMSLDVSRGTCTGQKMAVNY